MHYSLGNFTAHDSGSIFQDKLFRITVGLFSKSSLVQLRIILLRNYPAPTLNAAKRTFTPGRIAWCALIKDMYKAAQALN